MQIVSKCTNCGKSFNLDDIDIGRNAECSGCGTKFIIAKEEPAVQIRPPTSGEQVRAKASKAIDEQYAQSEPSNTAPTNRKTVPKGSQQPFSKVAQQYIPQNTFGDYLTFKAMVAPIVLQIMFWLIVAGIIFSFVLSLSPASSSTEGPQLSPQMKVLQTVSETPEWLIFVLKVIGVAMTIFFLRLFTEVFILLFKIFDVLKDIKMELQQQK